MRTNSFDINRSKSPFLHLVLALVVGGSVWAVSDAFGVRGYTLIGQVLCGVLISLLLGKAVDDGAARCYKATLAQDAFSRYLEGAFKAQMDIVIVDLRKKHKVYPNQVHTLHREIKNIIVYAIAGDMCPEDCERRINELAHGEEARLFGNLLVCPPVRIRLVPRGDYELYINGQIWIEEKIN
jgi:hypothetical protein